MADVWANSMACHPRATYPIAGCWHSLGEFTVVIPEPHATLQGVRILSVILKIVFHHVFFVFLMQFGLWRAAAFVSSPIHLLFEYRVHCTDFVFCAPLFHLFHCFLCILCNAILLLTLLVVVTSILIVHFDICILPKYIFWWQLGELGERKLQEGEGMSPVLILDWGIEATVFGELGLTMLYSVAVC